MEVGAGAARKLALLLCSDHKCAGPGCASTSIDNLSPGVQLPRSTRRRQQHALQMQAMLRHMLHKLQKRLAPCSPEHAPGSR